MASVRISILFVCILIVLTLAGCGPSPATVTNTPSPWARTSTPTVKMADHSTRTWTPPPEIPIPAPSEVGAPVITLSPEQLTAQAGAVPPSAPEPTPSSDNQPPPPPGPVPAPTGFPTPPEYPQPENPPPVEPTMAPEEAWYPETALFDFSRFDPDTFQPIDIAHSPPLIARTDETLRLVFHFVNLICAQLPIPCTPDAGLIVSSSGQPDLPVPVRAEIVDGLAAVVTNLPAAGASSASLRYYLQIHVPELNYFQRYPPRGTLQVFTTPAMIRIDLPEQAPLKTGILAYSFSWGDGTGQVRWRTYSSYPLRVGPPAFALAGDGRIALLDPVAAQLLLLDPATGVTTSLPLPFEYRFQGQLQFDSTGRLAVFDPVGRPLDPSNVSIPRLYLFDQNGSLLVEAPVYAKSPAQLSWKLEVLDLFDYRLVSPLDPGDLANPRHAQREKRVWEFPCHFVAGQESYMARFADLQFGAAFELQSISPLGAIARFERTPQGYLAVFRGDELRAVWFDTSGTVLKDISLANNQFSEIILYGQTAVDAGGSLYVLGSTSSGIEVRVYRAP